MSRTFLFLSMLFAHIVDDYYLQGMLANMKQRKWWARNAPQPMYRHDYLVALAMHSMSWSFMILFPIALSRGFVVGFSFIFAFLVNALIHGIVDNLKANCRKINLIQDQTVHIFQIILSFVILA